MTLLLLLLDPFDGRDNVLQASIPASALFEPDAPERLWKEAVKLHDRMAQAKDGSHPTSLKSETFIPLGSSVKVSVEQTTAQFPKP